MILTVTLNPCLHRYLLYRDVEPRATVVRPVETRLSSGGKGFNVARLIGRLGGEAVALGTVGGASGMVFRECLQREAVRAELVEMPGATRTSTCLFDRLSGRFREFLEPGEDVPREVAEQLRERFARLLPAARLVTLNGSSPGPQLDPLFAEFCAAARERGIPVILDSYGSPAPAAAAVPPDWIRANREELESTYRCHLPAELPGLFARLRSRGLAGVVVSDGPGLVWCHSVAGIYRVRPPAVVELNPVGSGDALTAAFALALVQGKDVASALREGAAAGSANAAELLVGELTAARMQDLLDQVEVEEVTAV